MNVSRKEWSLAGGAALLALGVRLLPWKAYFDGAAFHFRQPDAYYHLRRTTLILDLFPRLPGADPYMAYPLGAECPWPPLYDLIAAAVSYVVGLGRPTPLIVAGVATLLPPILAGLTVIPVFLLARLLGGTAAGVAAALVFVAVPPHLRYSTVGSGDHHTAEALLLAALLYLFLWSADGRNASERRRRAVAAGAVLGSSILVWQGSVAFAALLAGGVLLWWLAWNSCGRTNGGKAAGSSLRCAVYAMGAALFVVSAARLIFPSETAQTKFDFGFFSWFQPLFLGLLFAGLLVLLLFERKQAAAGTRPFLRTAVPVAGCLLALLGAALMFPGFRNGVNEAFRFLMSRDHFLRAIEEFQPPFGSSILEGPISFGKFTDWLYVLTFLLPMVVFPLSFVGELRRKAPSLETALFAFSAVLIGTLALIQTRWGNAHAIAMAVGVGWAAGRVMDRGRKAQESRFRGTRKDPRAPRTSAAFRLFGWKRFPVLAAFAVTLFLSIPSLMSVGMVAAGRTEGQEAAGLVPDLFFERLKENTPGTRGLHGSEGGPEYAVFCDSSLGHQVQYVAERPTIVNNFGYQLRGGGLEDMARVYLAPNEEELAKVLSRRGVRYLIAQESEISIYLRWVAGLIGIDFDRTFTETQPLPDGRMARVANAAFLELPYVRLVRFVLAPAPSMRPPCRFRLVYEFARSNPRFPGGVERLLVFEFVKGAVIGGKARPGAEVVLSCRLATDAGRIFSHVAVSRAGSDGTFSVTFPYPTEPAALRAVVALGPATASSGAISRSIEIREEDVIQGRTLSMDLR